MGVLSYSKMAVRLAPQTRSLLLLGLLLSVAASTTWAAKLPPEVTDQPVELNRHPLGEVRTAIEQSIDQEFGDLKDDGLEPFVNYWGTYLTNPVGGQQRGAAWAQLLVFGGEYHLDKLGWQGGSIFISATDFSGQNLSQKVGNVFTLSQAVVIDTFALYGLYLKQKLWNDALEFRLGRISAGQVFASLPMMGLPVSGAVNGNPTSLFTNSPFHATGSASWAAFVKALPTRTTYAQAGIFQASPETSLPANHGVNFSIQKGDGALIMLEVGWLPNLERDGGSGTPSSTPASTALADKGDSKNVVAPTAHHGLPGQYSFGAYYSNYTFPTFSGGVAHNTYGFYLQGQQMVWRSEANLDHHLTLWSGITASPQEEMALLPVMGYGGAAWQGLVPGRNKDDVLLDFYIGGFSSDYSREQASAGSGYATAETVLEASYIVQLSENVQLQPDLQWVIHPNGSASIPNALVVGFQVSALF